MAKLRLGYKLGINAHHAMYLNMNHRKMFGCMAIIRPPVAAPSQWAWPCSL